MREPEVGHMALADLERIRRELAASVALARPGALSVIPAEIQLSAIDAELAAYERRGENTTGVRLCTCGYGADSDVRFGAHLGNNPDHRERDQPLAVVAYADSCHWPQCKIMINGQAYCDEGRGCNGHDPAPDVAC